MIRRSSTSTTVSSRAIFAAAPAYARAHSPRTHHARTPPKANDYWTSVDDTLCAGGSGQGNISITDLWSQPAGGSEGPAAGLNNSWSCSQTNQSADCKYEDELFAERVLATIAAHDPATPLFLFWAPHIAHAPLEVPQSYLDKFAFIPDMNRRTCA